MCFLSPVHEMNACDEGLKRTIQNLWPVQTKKDLFLYVPTKEGQGNVQNSIRTANTVF